MGPVDFTKYEAAGNDFLVVDGDSHPGLDAGSFARRACRRRLGIGADGVLHLAREGSRHRVRVFNADGGEAETSGNGLRCAARYLVDRGEASADTSIALTSGAGPLAARLEGDRVWVQMGPPQLRSPDLPTSEDRGPVSLTFDVDGRRLSGWALSMGNPHLVLVLDPAQPLEAVELGRAAHVAADSGVFPRGVNVEVVRVVGRGRIRARVWERGVGETRACGSGACAAVAALALTAGLATPADVEMPGGMLRVTWGGGAEEPMWLGGPARRVFTGRFAG